MGTRQSIYFIFSALLTASLTETAIIQRRDVRTSNVRDVQFVARGVGFFSIAEFNEQTASDVEEAIASLQASAASSAEESLQALVIDLRGNGGGLISSAFDVASYFLPKNVILSRISGGGNKNKADVVLVRSLNRKSDLKTGLLLLVDGYTASSSEILMAALCDNKRAKSLGRKTLGKNVAQV